MFVQCGLVRLLFQKNQRVKLVRTLVVNVCQKTVKLKVKGKKFFGGKFLKVLKLFGINFKSKIVCMCVTDVLIMVGVVGRTGGGVLKTVFSFIGVALICCN